MEELRAEIAALRALIEKQAEQIEALAEVLSDRGQQFDRIEDTLNGMPTIPRGTIEKLVRHYGR